MEALIDAGVAENASSYRTVSGQLSLDRLSWQADDLREGSRFREEKGIMARKESAEKAARAGELRANVDANRVGLLRYFSGRPYRPAG